MDKTFKSRALQLDSELDAFIGILQAEGVTSFLEIGSKFGGLLWRVGNALPKGSRIVSVDLGVNGPSLPDCIKALRMSGYDSHLIVGDSTGLNAIEAAQKLGPYDAVFIDGNHKMAYVRADWANYGPMARKIVAFHDIGWRRRDGGNKAIIVPEFWDSIKAGYRHQDIIHQLGDNGIGVIWREVSHG